MSRRKLLGGAGVLFVSFSLVGCKAGSDEPRILGGMAIDPTNAASWVEIGADNNILLRTGNSDFGQSTVYTAYRQIVAEELHTTVDAITSVVTGDTDRTPDGGGSYAFLGNGSPNVRKAAAYVYQALLDLGAVRLGVPREQLKGENGAFSSGGKTVTYGELVSGQELKLTIPVTEMWPMGLVITGDPPMRPVSEYKIIGKSIDNPATAAKVSGKQEWLSDFTLPGMLHARIVRPHGLGAKLKSVGKLDDKAFPNTQIVEMGNLLAVVSPDEWEAVQAATVLSSDTEWTEWHGLPGNDGLMDALRKLDWKTAPVQTGEGGKKDVSAAFDKADKRIEGSYFLPYMKHAPIGPSMAVAEVQSDGKTYIYAHVQNPQMLRRRLADMFGESLDNIVVRVMAGPGHYGRSNGGAAGGEDEAALLARKLKHPVRVQWSRAEDMQWSTQSPAGFSNIRIALDGDGKMIGYDADHYMPSMYDDRLIGGLLAGKPVDPAPNETQQGLGTGTINLMWDGWNYGHVADYSQRAHGARQIGDDSSPLGAGLRGHSMRTPGQFQQNFPRELAISEAAAAAAKDPLQFRIDHATDERVIGVLEAVRDRSGWQRRPSPNNPALRTANDIVSGQGVSLIFRQGTYWACVCKIALTLSTGAIKVEKITVAADPGVIINPKQLKRQAEGGIVMGVSQAIREEVQFDKSGVTSEDWNSYPILTMADTPDIEVVLIDNPAVGIYGGGSEAANTLPAAAIAAALHDATGRFVRHLPLSPEKVRAAITETGSDRFGPVEVS